MAIGDKSGTITTGGTAQTLMDETNNRKGFFIQNNSAGDLWIRESATAAATQPSIKIEAGAQLYASAEKGDYMPKGSISIFGATTGQAFTAREW